MKPLGSGHHLVVELSSAHREMNHRYVQVSNYTVLFQSEQSSLSNICNIYSTRNFSEPIQKSKMKLFAKIVTS